MQVSRSSLVGGPLSCKLPWLSEPLADILGHLEFAESNAMKQGLRASDARSLEASAIAILKNLFSESLKRLDLRYDEYDL